MPSVEKEKIYYNALNIITETNWRLLASLFDEFGSFSDAYLNFQQVSKAEKYFGRFKKVDPEKEFEALRKLGISLLLKKEELFPLSLGEIFESPLGIYVKTDLPLAEIFKGNFSLAIVGTRKATVSGKETAKKFAYEIGSLGGTIVSGLALGIDTSAHLGALEAGGLTVAVLARGLDKVYPPSNNNLAEKIVSQGALVSEYPLGMPAFAYNFVARNRIISGLSLGVLVVEAPEKSGALITANFALSQNREVFAVPNSIYARQSAGCNRLIQKGAKLVTDTGDILEEIKSQAGLKLFAPKEKINFGSESQREIFNLLSQSPEGLDIDKISEKIKLEANEVLSEMSILELNGFVKNAGGRWKAVR